MCQLPCQNSCQFPNVLHPLKDCLSCSESCWGRSRMSVQCSHRHISSVVVLGHFPHTAGERESTAVLAPHRSPAVTATLCLSFPHCSQGDAVTWHRAGGASASPQHLESSRKWQGFPPTHSAVWQHPCQDGQSPGGGFIRPTDSAWRGWRQFWRRC